MIFQMFDDSLHVFCKNQLIRLRSLNDSSFKRSYVPSEAEISVFGSYGPEFGSLTA